MDQNKDRSNSVSLMVIQASLDLTDTKKGAVLRWLIGYGRHKDVLRMTLLECERLQPESLHCKQSAEIKRTVARNLKKRYGIAWWIPIAISIIYEVIKWWLEHRNKSGAFRKNGSI